MRVEGENNEEGDLADYHSDGRPCMLVSFLAYPHCDFSLHVGKIRRF